MKSKGGAVIFVVVILCAVLLFTSFYVQSRQFNGTAQSEVVVTLTKKGFDLTLVHIVQGGVVHFKNSSDDDFWPASDLHPTHAMYPEFDPKQPVAAGQTWSFTFTKVGTWKYHNHLNPLQTGVVVVEGGDGSSGAKSPADACGNGQEQTVACWQEQLESTLIEGGVDGAFTKLAELYNAQPQFVLECHSFAHLIGKAAYEQYSRKKEVALSPKSSYCGYGFYHGFMETLLHTSGAVQEAKDFCAYAGKTLAAETTDAEGACFHGIGHGFVDGSDPTTWGDAEKMMKPGMDLCERVAGDDRSQYGKLYRCVTGVYNGIEILSQEPKYKLDSIVQQPFALCQAQPQEFLEGCYTNMLPAQMRLEQDNFKKLIADIGNIQAPVAEVKGPVLSSLFHEYVRLHLTDTNYGLADGLALCRAAGDLRLYCVDGLSGGLMKYGKPRQEYVAALDFCARSSLRRDESDRCYSYILPRLRIWYTEERKKEICQSVPLVAQKYCN